jgi:pimeloyl-ACP methyl ester carboxylesterase
MVNDPNLEPSTLSAIQARTLVIAGTHDMIKDAHTRLIARSIPDAQLVLLEGSHFIANEKPVEFNRAVLGFLKQ